MYRGPGREWIYRVPARFNTATAGFFKLQEIDELEMVRRWVFVKPFIPVPDGSNQSMQE
jgi:hypothetical protein